jgi:hypothetical protein
VKLVDTEAVLPALSVDTARIVYPVLLVKRLAAIARFQFGVAQVALVSTSAADRNPFAPSQ